MRFQLLGSLEVWGAHGLVTPTARMQRRVLALLLLEANKGVRVDPLVEELWGDRPPLSARTTLQTYIYHLRKLFKSVEPADRAGREPDAVLLTRPAGYELRLGTEDSFDVHEFNRHVARAKAMRDHGLLEDAGVALRSALDLWSGPALADVETGSLLSAEKTRLDEGRRAALELRLDIDLQLGRHHELVSELTSLVNAEPAHEGFVAKLMLALVRCGRRAEALEVYRRARAQLVAEYGLEPSGETQQLHQAILNDEADLTVNAPAPARTITSISGAPAQLPPGIADFVGRSAEMDRVRAALTGGDRDRAAAGEWHRSGLKVAEILGLPGVGKSTFTIQVARHLRPLYPDGQFYEHVGGLDGRPDGLAAVLGRLLRACGVPAERLPTSVGELSSMFRTWTADRRVLVVLDDVASAADLRALQPAGPGCAVLFTARTRLAGLAGATAIDLPPFTPEEALTLFRNVLGARRVDAEPDAARRLAALCDHLPLALRAVATRLAMRPRWSLAGFAGRLAVAEDRLAELGPDGRDLVASVEVSCGRLGDVVRGAFHTIAAGGVSTVTASTVARMCCLGTAAAEATLEHLVDAYLVIECPPRTDMRGKWRNEPSYRLPQVLGAAARLLGSRGADCAWVG